MSMVQGSDQGSGFRFGKRFVVKILRRAAVACAGFVIRISVRYASSELASSAGKLQIS